MSVASTPSALIDLEAVDVDIGGVAILRDIRWRLEPGRHWGVVGPNGSGKSTFLALLAGERWPAPGRGTRRYDFGSGTQRDAVEARREIATVGPELQDRYWRRGWSFAALDVVLSGLYRTDVPRRSASAAEAVRARAILRELGLARLAARPFLELSRGEQRRVLIARGVAFGARVLLLDEPASGLDRAARRDLGDLLRRVAARAQLVVTAHSMEELPPIVTDVLELAEGRIVRLVSGTRSRDRAAPTSAATAPRPARPPQRRPEPRPEPHAELRATPGRERPSQDEPARAPLIEVRRADVWLGGRRVLHGLDWRLAEGEHWLVAGANGAGKSTFLRLLHGQLRPALGGAVRWPGLGEPRGVWRLRRLVGWCSPELQANYRYRATVRECVASGLDSSLGLVRTLARPEHERVDTLLERFELTALADRPTSELSYGQFRRTLLARALAPRPRVLLLDEPWEGLDPAARHLLATRLDDSLAEGVQLVCAAHLETASGRFTHELVLDKGQVRAARPLRAAPEHPVPVDATDASPPPGQGDPASLS